MRRVFELEERARAALDGDPVGWGGRWGAEQGIENSVRETVRETRKRLG